MKLNLLTELKNKLVFEYFETNIILVSRCVTVTCQMNDIIVFV